ncbi:MAG: hypothetical protein ACHQNV_02505 [Vicinamibacteria bacterium]
MDSLLDPIAGSDHREVGGVQVDIVKAGSVRVGRFVYPPGFRWSTHMKGVVGSELCRHAHVGFLARGRIEGAYRDGCSFRFTAPAVVVLEAGHDAWVVGDEAAVLVHFDAENETARRFGLPDEHRHP